MLVRGERHVQVAGEFQVADVLGEQKEEGGLSHSDPAFWSAKLSSRADQSFHFFFSLSLSLCLSPEDSLRGPRE